MIIKYKILKFMKPLVIVSNLKGTGENPAMAKRVIQAITPPSEETLSRQCFFFKTAITISFFNCLIC